MKKGVGKAGAIEFIRGCEQFKAYHKHLFGVEVKSFVTVAKNLKKSIIGGTISIRMDSIVKLKKR